ncbi:sulfur oxidation c-type cytochrome SoxX [Roseibacterium sp. KMU-115]|uniref:Sulfur oxidation c-type cytochrome SoxX n=2 Tax=Roseicyclus persicicus TaxID=2650661 RepID=A0A7X6H2Q1_9RHOB|nr:sulfur oxidation c-type cytochrome SoxX [Roseibacterium persicicum]NKX45746.1 sulfur oxidation c-type cytochrome SoxX [Roseibacterium persicicum]
MLLAATIGLAATSLQADVIAPGDVVMTEYGEVTESLTGVPGDPARGQAIMVDRGQGNCLACHQVTALDHEPWHGEVGPSLDGVATRWDEAALRGLLVNADTVFPDSIMPAFYKVSGFVRPGDGFTTRPAPADLQPMLAAQDIEDVVAFLMTLTDY